MRPPMLVPVGKQCRQFVFPSNSTIISEPLIGIFLLLVKMRGGGSRPIQMGFIRSFGILCQKNGGFYIKKLVVFFYHFSPKRRRESGPSKKKSFSEKAEVVKKGRGGGLSFLSESKKTVFFVPHLII